MKEFKPWEGSLVEGHSEWISLPREGYDKAMELANKLIEFAMETKKYTEYEGYNLMEVVYSYLLGHLWCKEKCRIVIEYDPAEKDVQIMRLKD